MSGGGIKNHTPIRKKYAKNGKQIIILVIGIIIGASSCVYAATSIASSAVSYSNSNTSATTVKEALDEIMAKSTCLTGEYLSDVVSVGDYVAYDTGSWTSTVSKPTSEGSFGGYTSGQNKANSSDTTSLKGWRVLNVDKDTKTVTLVHAGISEYYYGLSYTKPYESIYKLNLRAVSEYLNSDYAITAHMMTYEEANALASTNELRNIGVDYWLATTPSTQHLYYCYSSGNSFGAASATSKGIRPVIILVSGIKTTGKGTDVVGQEAWTLVKP